TFEPSTPGTLISSGLDCLVPAPTEGTPGTPLSISAMLAAPESRNEFQLTAPPTALSSARTTKAAKVQDNPPLLLRSLVPPGAGAARIEAAGAPIATVVASSPNETTGDKPFRTRLRSSMSSLALAQRSAGSVARSFMTSASVPSGTLG